MFEPVADSSSRAGMLQLGETYTLLSIMSGFNCNDTVL